MRSYACRSRVYLDQATRAISFISQEDQEGNGRVFATCVSKWPAAHRTLETRRVQAGHAKFFVLCLSTCPRLTEALKQCCHEIGWDLEVDIQPGCRPWCEVLLLKQQSTKFSERPSLSKKEGGTCPLK